MDYTTGGSSRAGGSMIGKRIAATGLVGEGKEEGRKDSKKKSRGRNHFLTGKFRTNRKLKKVTSSTKQKTGRREI